MTPGIAKVLIRVAGTLIGLLGVGMLWFSSFLIYHSFTEQDPWMIALAVFPCALTAYFLYVMYLVWFRFSQLAVRYLCGALGFYVFTIVVGVFDITHGPDTVWKALAFFGCAVVIYCAYRLATVYLGRWLFRESALGAQS